MIGATSPIGNFYNIRVSPPERTTLSTVKSCSVVDCDGESKEKDPLVACFDEIWIDFVSTVGGVSLAEAPEFKKAPGGAPVNVDFGIERLAGSAAFVGKVGDDEFGYMLFDILKQNNVDDFGVWFGSKGRNALAFVKLSADGDHEFMAVRNPSAEMLLRESELNKDFLKKASVFIYVSVSLSEETFSSTEIAALKIPKKAGCILSYDPTLRLALWPLPEDAKKDIMSIWDQADIIKINEGEISFLTDDNVFLKKLFYPNVELSLVTEGSEGCRYYTKECKGKVCGVKINCAGDAFESGQLNSFSADLNLYKDEKKLRISYFVCKCLWSTHGHRKRCKSCVWKL